MMTEQTKQKIKYWIFGLFTGGIVATPITAFICKNVYDKKIEQVETNALNDMAEYAVQQQKYDKTEKKLTEEDYAEKPANEDIFNYDISIDDSTISTYSVTGDDGNEDPETEEAHQRYLDMIDRYTNNEELPPRIISADEFLNEQFMEKSYVNWYEEDDVFEEDLHVIEDPFATFGVTSGRELFKNAESRPDPDICYVRNERTTTDFEINRIHGSYAKLVGGEMNLGETDT